MNFCFVWLLNNDVVWLLNDVARPRVVPRNRLSTQFLSQVSACAVVVLRVMLTMCVQIPLPLVPQVASWRRRRKAAALATTELSAPAKRDSTETRWPSTSWSSSLLDCSKCKGVCAASSSWIRTPTTGKGGQSEAHKCKFRCTDWHVLGDVCLNRNNTVDSLPLLCYAPSQRVKWIISTAESCWKAQLNLLYCRGCRQSGLLSMRESANCFSC